MHSVNKLKILNLEMIGMIESLIYYKFSEYLDPVTPE